MTASDAQIEIAILASIERQANRLVKDTKMDMSEITTFTAADVREN